MGVKLAVAGGGSTYTPELVEGLAARGGRLQIDELVLLDVDLERLGVVARLAERQLRRIGWAGGLWTTDDPRGALDAASFVIVQLRVGGNRARLLDEAIPPRFGCIGQETTGPGGFAKALRTVPVVLELAELTDRVAAKDAWFVDFTNPTGLVTQALLDEGHRAVGLCNVAIGFQREFAARVGVDPDRVQLEHVGLNHLSWERKVLVDGRDRLPRLLDAIDAEEFHGTGIDVVRRLRAVPSGYLRYYERTDEILAQQRSGRTRAEDVIEIERELLALYADPSLDRPPDLLARRGGAFYSEAAAALVASLHDGAGDVQVADVRNGGAIPNLEPDDVVEVACVVDRDGAHPLPVDPLCSEMLDLVRRVKAYERRTIEAARSGSWDDALEALMLNPLAPSDPRVAAALLRALLEAHRAHLPRFFPDGAPSEPRA